mgnify:FL=1
MRKYSSNLAFVDLLFNLLVGFTSLFVIAFLLINPIAKQGVVDPPVKVMFEISWDDKSYHDIDLYLKGPDNQVVYYANKTNGYITLKRDDLGFQTDTYEINGKVEVVERNYEITTMSSLPDGDYVVNVHFYARGKRRPTDPVNIKVANLEQEVFVRVTSIQPFKILADTSTILKYFQEQTILVFKVSDGKIVEVRDDIQVRLRKKHAEQGGGF